MRNLLLVLAFAAISGGATAQTPAPPAGAFIKLVEGGCGFISACPAYAITLKPDGSYRYEGYRHVAIVGVREGLLPAGAWAEAEKAFVAAGWSTLSEPTSRQGGYPCMPDSPFAQITRQMGEEDGKVFSYNLGCDSETANALLQALKRVLPMPPAE